MVKVKNNGVYIRTVEAAMIWEHNNRKIVLGDNFTGNISHSLELIQLRKNGLDEYVKRLKPKLDDNGNKVLNDKNKVIMEEKRIPITEIDKRTLKSVNRTYTDDVINVKFNSKVHKFSEILKKINKNCQKEIKKVKVSYEKDENKDISLLKDEIKNIENERDNKIKKLENVHKLNSDMWDISIGSADLRNMMYEKGFTLTNYKGENLHYLPYKRSSAKARKGEILFIRKELYESMSSWSRMGLEIPKDVKIDLAALSAYEALVTSSIESTIKINPKNILIISDVDSIFEQKAKVIELTTDANGKDILHSVDEEKATIKNSLWDGQGLLDSSYFTGDYKDKGMMLLRQHFFKSCMFNTNIKQFMEDQFKEDYDTAKIKDMFGTPVKVSDIKCIITPSSLKVFKFSNLVGTDKKMYNHWKKVIRNEKNVFGICKSEYATKRGLLDEMPLQQMSYQMINSLPLDKTQATELSQFEVDYINEMKNNNNRFIEHLERTASLTNSNQMIVDLYNHIKDFAKTELFIKFKTDTISEYGKHIRKGKLRIIGDYLVLTGNPYEMLLHSINKLDLHNLKSHTLQDNQVYTKLFKDKEELAGFRNPHTSANNILYAHNIHNKLIDTYFNFTNNIIVVNAINFAIQDLLSGCDYDSDTLLATNNKIIVKIAENNKAEVCLNKVSATSNKYILNNLNRSEVDKAIASDVIGRIVNVGQAAQSCMYNARNKGNVKLANKMKEVVEIISVASTISIDLAKKSYKIDIVKELDRLDKLVKSNLIKDKNNQPLFPMFMQQKSKRTTYDTAMDYIFKLFNVSADNMDGVQRADEIKKSEVINIMDIIKKCDEETGEIFEIADANDKQEHEILGIVSDYTINTATLHSMKKKVSDDERKKISKEITREAMDLQSKMQKRTIKSVTIYAMLYHLFYKKSIDCSAIKVMNAIYLSNTEKFIDIFVQEK